MQRRFCAEPPIGRFCDNSRAIFLRFLMTDCAILQWFRHRFIAVQSPMTQSSANDYCGFRLIVSARFSSIMPSSPLPKWWFHHAISSPPSRWADDFAIIYARCSRAIEPLIERLRDNCFIVPPLGNRRRNDWAQIIISSFIKAFGLVFHRFRKHRHCRNDDYGTSKGFCYATD